MNGPVGELRDIYYIILDAYSSPDVIRQIMGFEKEDEMVASLEKRGFFVAKQSLSNYYATGLSLPSSLNMIYLQSRQASNSNLKMVEDNAVKDFLGYYGYRYLHFGADAFTYFNRYADENVNLTLFSPYQWAVWENTAFSHVENFLNNEVRFAAKMRFLDRRFLQWERVQFQLRKLAEVPEKRGAPVFVFAHFLLPHAPYVFDADGNFVTGKEATERNAVENYLGQVAYINKEVVKLVDTLLERSEPEPIIILQGDHGFRFSNDEDMLKNLAEPDRAKKLIVPGINSLPILNAYYFPDGGDKLLYDSITPVNTFRVLLNYYFGQNLDLLDDVSYIPDPGDQSGFIPWNPQF